MGLHEERSSKPPKPGFIRLSIQVENNGSVTFGSYSTEKFEFEADFPKGQSIHLKAEPAKDFQFLYWEMKTSKNSHFDFVSSKPSTSIRNPEKNMIIRAMFGEIEQ